MKELKLYQVRFKLKVSPDHSIVDHADSGENSYYLEKFHAEIRLKKLKKKYPNSKKYAFYIKEKTVYIMDWIK